MKILKRIIFYFLSFTWGGVMSLIGLVGLLVTACIKDSKFSIFCGRICVEVGKNNWGGVSLGCFIFCSKGSSKSLKAHESGHTLQNIVFGPLFPFVVAIPSAIRYQYREYRYRYGLPVHTQYDDIWFEGQATKLGQKYFMEA